MTKRILVTGAAQGLGRAFAEHLSSLGWRVLAVDTKKITLARPLLRSVVCDVTSESDLQAAVGLAKTIWGGLDGAVANAAVFEGLTRAPADKLSVDEWDKVFSVNVKGVWLTVRAVLPALRAAGGGSIVTIASEVFANGSINFAHYVASKAAVIGLTRALAREFGPEGIRVNALAPGYTDTEGGRSIGDPNNYDTARTPLGRVAVSDDMLGVCEFLLRDQSSFITGQTILVNGGRIMQ